MKYRSDDYVHVYVTMYECRGVIRYASLYNKGIAWSRLMTALSNHGKYIYMTHEN